MDLNKRYLVTDTETTGFNHGDGDRLVEIGIVELIGNRATGRTFHKYINPQGKKVGDSFKVHGLSDDFLSDKDSFRKVRDEFLEFIGDDDLVIHNAPFDMGFLNMELQRANKGPLENKVIDTVPMARKLLPPGARASLDALCNRFDIDNSGRTLHGALIDADLLASVFIHLTGMNQLNFGEEKQNSGENQAAAAAAVIPGRRSMPRREAFFPTPDEVAAHLEFIGKMNPSIWGPILEQKG